MSINDQPTSRRAARMLEREQQARATGEQPSAPIDLAGEPRSPEAAVESTAQRAAEPVKASRAVVSDAIFAGASWARSAGVPVTAAEPEPEPEPAPVPVAPVAEPPSFFAPPASATPAAAVPAEAAALPAEPIVRRRDLRARPADAPPVGLTGEVAVDPASLTGPRPEALVEPVDAQPAPAPEPEPVAAVQEPISPAPVAGPVADAPEAAEPVAEAPTASVFAAPAPGAAPSWAAPASPTPVAPSGTPETVEAPVEHSVSRRALRATGPAPELPTVEAHDDDVKTSTMPPRSVEPTAAWTTPHGHWSRQLEADDNDEPLESTFSRSVGSTAPTTNALVIPDAPPLDLSGPLTATGEIMLTGSIRLPDAFARTGATEHVDLADRDDLDDLHQEAPSLDFPADSQPIRAAAVSGEHALGSPIVSTAKPGRGNRVLTGLLITACALAVVVTGLIITAFAVGIV